MIRNWGEASWNEIEALEPGRTTAILPLGAVEAHGPHLPLNTDGIIAQAMAQDAAQRLDESGYDVLILPPLAYAAAPFAAGFAGTISARPETVAGMIDDVGTALAGRVACLAIANAHLDPAHLESVHAAVEALRVRLPVAFPDLTRRRLARRLTEEFRSGACHAGRFEGSIVLATRPDLVREDVRDGLSPVPISLSKAMRQQKWRFEEAGMDQAYCGDPGAATADEGRGTIRELGAILAEAVLEAVGGEG
jgi:creatinine amidohydrolase